MYPRIIFALAALIFSVGYLFRSLPFAHAFPQVSLGSNPIAHQMFECGTSENFTNSSGYPFIIIDVLAYSSNYLLILRIDGTRTVALHADSDVAGFVEASLSSGIVVQPGGGCNLHNQYRR